MFRRDANPARATPFTSRTRTVVASGHCASAAATVSASAPFSNTRPTRLPVSFAFAAAICSGVAGFLNTSEPYLHSGSAVSVAVVRTDVAAAGRAGAAGAAAAGRAGAAACAADGGAAGAGDADTADGATDGGGVTTGCGTATAGCGTAAAGWGTATAGAAATTGGCTTAGCATTTGCATSAGCATMTGCWTITAGGGGGGGGCDASIATAATVPRKSMVFAVDSGSDEQPAHTTTAVTPIISFFIFSRLLVSVCLAVHR